MYTCTHSKSVLLPRIWETDASCNIRVTEQIYLNFSAIVLGRDSIYLKNWEKS